MLQEHLSTSRGVPAPTLGFLQDGHPKTLGCTHPKTSSRAEGAPRCLRRCKPRPLAISAPSKPTEARAGEPEQGSQALLWIFSPPPRFGRALPAALDFTPGASALHRSAASSPPSTQGHPPGPRPPPKKKAAGEAEQQPRASAQTLRVLNSCFYDYF